METPDTNTSPPVRLPTRSLTRAIFRAGDRLVRADSWHNRLTQLWQPRITLRSNQGADVYLPRFCGKGFISSQQAMVVAVAEAQRWSDEHTPGTARAVLAETDDAGMVICSPRFRV